MSKRRPGSRQYAALDRRKWAKARRACFTRDRYRCRKCGAAGALEAHHVKPLDKGGARYALDNLETLCRACHIEHHKPKLSEDERKWQELLARMME